MAGRGDAEQLFDLDRRKERQRPETIDQRGRRQRVPPESGTPLLRRRVRGEGPRRGFHDVRVRGVARGEDALDVVAQGPDRLLADDVDGRGRHHRILVVDQFGERRLRAARAGLQDRSSVLDLLVDRRWFEHRQQRIAQRPREHVVEVLQGGGALARGAAFDRPPGRHHVAPAVNQAEQPVDAVRCAIDLLAERLRQHRVLRQAGAFEQAVMLIQAAEVDEAFSQGEPLDRGRIEREGRLPAAQLFGRAQRLEPQEAVAGVEQGHDDVHRRLTGDARERRRYVTPHPDVFARIAEDLLQRVDDRFPVSDQRLPRRPLQPAVAEEGYQRRREADIGHLERPDGPHHLVGHRRIGVLQQRRQQVAGPPVAHPANRRREVAPHLAGALARVGRERGEDLRRGAPVARVVAARQHQRGGGRNAGIGVADERPTDRRRLLVADGGERLDRGHPHPGAGIGDQPLDGRGPPDGDVGARRAERAERPGAHRGGLVMQQQRRDEVALVERFQHVDRIEHPALVGMGELLDQRLHRGEVGHAQAHLARQDALTGDRLTERRQVLPARADRTGHPQRGDGQTDPAQLTPRQPESPRLNQDERQHRAEALREPVHGDVDERFGPMLQIGRQRQEQDFPRRLVDRVPQRRVEDAPPRRRPERAGDQNQAARRAEADRQNQQGEPDAEMAVDAARQPDLNDQAGQRQVELHLAEERRDAVGAAAARRLLDRHVQLLVEQAGADRRKNR